MQQIVTYKQSPTLYQQRTGGYRGNCFSYLERKKLDLFFTRDTVFRDLENALRGVGEKPRNDHLRVWKAMKLPHFPTLGPASQKLVGITWLLKPL